LFLRTHFSIALRGTAFVQHICIERLFLNEPSHMKKNTGERARGPHFLYTVYVISCIYIHGQYRETKMACRRELAMERETMKVSCVTVTPTCMGSRRVRNIYKRNISILYMYVYYICKYNVFHVSEVHLKINYLRFFKWLWKYVNNVLYNLYKIY